jgi:hypothetical protein
VPGETSRHLLQNRVAAQIGAGSGDSLFFPPPSDDSRASIMSKSPPPCPLGHSCGVVVSYSLWLRMRPRSCGFMGFLWALWASRGLMGFGDVEARVH